jgi:hypothetical protein
LTVADWLPRHLRSGRDIRVFVNVTRIAKSFLIECLLDTMVRRTDRRRLHFYEQKPLATGCTI